MNDDRLSRITVPADIVPRTAEHAFTRPRPLAVKNLRPLNDGSLEVTATPVNYESLGGCKPLGILKRKNGRLIVASSGTSVYTVDESTPAAPPVIYLSALPSAALCAMPQRSEESVLVMTAEGAVDIRTSESGIEVKRLNREYPAVMLTAADASPISTDVAARTLHKAYGTGGVLTQQDSDEAVADLTAAYLRLCEEASGAGVMIQPAICRYRLRDINGTVLFTSGPVLLSATSGAQLADPFGVMSDDRQTVSAYTVSADTWKLSAVLPADPAGAGADAAVLEVYMSPLFHPYDPDGEGYATLTRGASQSEPFMRVSMPGLMYGLGAVYRKGVGRTVRRMLARLDSLERCVATIPQPFMTTGGRTVEITVTQDGDVRSAMRGLIGAFRKKVARQPRTRTLMRPPHTLTARVCAADAQVTAWGDLGVVRFKGWNAQSQGVCADASKRWSTITVVKFSDGTGLMRSDSGEGDAPAAFSPLLSYPSADATEMKIVHLCDGRTTIAELKLEPDESGQYAVWVADRPVPQTFGTSGSPTTGTLTAPQDRWDDMVAFAPSECPLCVESCTQGLGSAIRALVKRDGHDQSWEFGRSKFVAGTSQGLFSIVLGADRSKVAVKNMAAGRVESASWLISGETSEIFALCGDNSDKGPALLRLTSRGVFELFESPRGYHALAYEPYRKELWALRTDGSADVFCRTFRWRRYERTGIGARSASQSGGISWLETPHGLLRPDREVSSAETEIEASYDIVPRGMRYVTAQSTDIVAEGSRVHLRLVVKSSGTGRRNELTRLDSLISGSLESPIRLYHPGRPLQRLTLTLSGTVSADFTLNSFRVYIK